ncbi:hypothetical protein RGCCGE502_27367 (plasmid) [Rhizobium grahamii CCGE 502]|uniref:DUF982 domain-containing protein n=2 Tax=Rhizobium grahamii TaxID=1120045 RepID=S3H8D4_9HYPH|nr:hypothetical protein RGCCGE502_27367 [Rhizobium grahamii CCGE 502]
MTPAAAKIPIVVGQAASPTLLRGGVTDLPEPVLSKPSTRPSRCDLIITEAQARNPQLVCELTAFTIPDRSMFISSPVPILRVAVSFRGGDDGQIATTVSEMTELLLSSRWPKKANDTLWRDALMTCLRSQQDEKKAKRARKAFVRAARGANITAKH